MSIISTTIPNLVNGVSQQPYALRLASQAEEQINGLSSVVEGLRKRPPSRHSAKIQNTPLTAAHVHMINRDITERYTVMVTNGDLRVYDLQGNQKTVNFPDGKTYLNSGNPTSDFQLVTVADYTFVLNRQVTVQRNTTKTSTRPFETMFWIRQGAYSANYSIQVGGGWYTHTTPDASTAANAPYIKTDYIAGQLVQQLINAGHTNANGWSVAHIGSLIYISRATDFASGASDSIGDTGIKLIARTVQRFSDLPAKGIGGFRVRVAGTNENAFDDYYVEFVAEPGNPNGGGWKETAKGGEDNSIHPYTMPHVLVRNADGTFTFRIAGWKDRKAGDLDSVPFPSFVGRKINDVFFYRNRLGFLSDENVVFSEASEFFNFFKKSAIQTLDTDAIDVAVSHIKVSILKHAVPFNESLLLFSDQTQFMLGKAELLTPRTISINQTTEFEANLQAKPVGAGTNVYFAQARGQFSGIREYFVDGETETNDAADVTAHCPRYIVGRVKSMAASTNEDMLAVLSEGKRDSLYVYRFYWSKGEKMQSSWSRWDFPKGSTILNMAFIESELWLVVSRADGVYIEVISLEAGRQDLPGTFLVNLDRRLSHSQMTATYNAALNETHITAPWTFQNGEVYEIVAWYGDDTQAWKPGQVVPYGWVNGSTMKVKGKLTRFFFGVSYTFRYRFSTFVVREEAAGGGGLQPIGEGRVQIRRVTVTYNNSGYFRSEVTPKARDTYKYIFSGRVIGSEQNKLNAVPIEQGIFRFPVAAKNDGVTIELVNDTYLPCSFLSAEWEAFFVLRSKRF